MSPSHHTTAPISPHSQDDSVGGDGSGSGSKNIFKKSAAKGRSRMEQKAKETGKDKGLQVRKAVGQQVVLVVVLVAQWW